MNGYLTPFSRAILTGLFVGIIATFVCIGYNILYRGETGFPLFDIINVSSLIFLVNILFVVVGLIYYWLRLAFKKDLVFVLVFVLLTVLFSWMAMHVQRSDNPLFNLEFHHLLLAMVIIMGAGASFGVPFLYRNKKFEEHVL